MKAAQLKQAPRYPADWSAFPGGETIHEAVASTCDAFSQRIFGYHMVKLGSLSSQIALPHCSVTHHIHQSPVPGESTGVLAASGELPYVENSIDGFLLAHELDYAKDPHQILREVDRCITQSGYVIISGFNPYSLTGLCKYLPIKRDNILHDARFFSANRVGDWLNLLGFEVLDQRHLLFSMLFFNRRGVMPLRWQNRLAKHMPWCASVYVIVARKRVWPMTTIRPKWKLKPHFSPVGASVYRQPVEATKKGSS